MSHSSKQALVATIVHLIGGVQKRFPNPNQPLSYGGKTTTPAVLTPLLQSFVDLLLAVVAARAMLDAKLQLLDAQLPAIQQEVSAVVDFIRATFGNSPDVLPDFGLEVHKRPAPKTVEEKTLAVQKALATRQARHTKGKKQLAAIHGVVPAPAPAAAAPAPVAPAPVAPAPGAPAPVAPAVAGAPAPAVPPAASKPAGGSA